MTGYWVAMTLDNIRNEIEKIREWVLRCENNGEDSTKALAEFRSWKQLESDVANGGDPIIYFDK